jgi:hypothetical protein
MWLGASGTTETPAKPEYSGQDAPKADSSKPGGESVVDTSVSTLKSAYETQVAALKK